MPPFEQFKFCLVFGGLGRAREKRPERNVVSACFASADAKVAAAMTRHPDLRIAPQFGARIGNRSIGLAKMNPVRIQTLGKANRNVDDEGHITRRADFLQRRGKAGGGVFVDILDPKLERRDRSRIAGALKPLGELARYIERRNQV